MKQGMELKIAAVVIICLVAFTSFVQAQGADESDKKLKGEVRFRYDWLGVRKDRGRFREDNWMTDRSTGGLDWLHLESTGPDENGYEWLLEGRAMYDYDYDFSLLIKKEDSHYLKLDFSSLRRYFDNSNEYWDEGVKHMLERSDFDIFVDRRNYNIEFGLTPPEGAHWVFGWHRLEKDGKEVLLRGSKRDDGSFYGIPDIANIKGITDTFYGEVSRTFADKYNFRIRQEFEQYHADRRGFQGASFNDDWSFDSGATDTDDKRFKDDLGYTNWRTMFMFDSFLDDQTYVTANYMYNYLNNNGTHDLFENPRFGLFVNETSVGNSRRTNVAGLGYRKANFLQVPALDFSAGVRVEDSKTSSQNYYTYWKSYHGGDPYTFKQATIKSSLDEVRVAEVLRLVYKGIKRTTLSFDADLEQRDLNWEASDTQNTNDFDRKTDIDFTDQVYTFKAVHRFNRAVKSTVKFRIKDLERSYTTLFDPHSDYPGYLGSYRRTGRDLTVKTDFRINSKTSSTLMYQFVQESMDFELGGKTSNMEIHRGMGSLSFSPMQNLFLVGTFMLENYKLDTPVTNDHEAGSRWFDFRGNSYSLLLDGTYAFNSKTSATLGFQHTEAMGTVDYAGDYVYDKIGLMLKHKFTANKTIGLGYQFMSFNNHAGRGDFDDYRAHGAIVTYACTF